MAVKYSIPTYSLVVDFLSIFSLLLDFPGLQQKVTLLFPLSHLTLFCYEQSEKKQWPYPTVI